MPYTPPATFTTGTILSAGSLNTNLRDNIDWLGGAKPSVRAKRTSLQSIANSTYVAAAYDAEDWDTASMHSTVTNNSRITIPSGGTGKYQIGWSGYWAINATGRRVVSLRKNTTTIVTEVEMMKEGGGVSSGTIQIVDSATAADFYEIFLLQSSGGALNLDAVSVVSYFWAYWYST